MNSNLTKILIAIVLGAVVLLSAFGVYRYLSGGGSTAPVSVPTPAQSSAFPESGVVSAPNDTGSNKTNNGGNTAGGRQISTQTTSGGSSPSQGAISGVLNLKVISEKPIAGEVFIERQDPETKVKTLYVRYMERESGHINELAYNENLPKKITNTTITRIYQSFFNNNNTSFLLRRLDENNNIQNIFATIQTASSSLVSASTTPIGEPQVAKLTQNLLPSSIIEVAVSPLKNKIFYLTNIGDSYIGTTEDFGSKVPAPAGASGGANKKQVFSSPLSEWLIQWPEANTLFFNTKPSANVPGYLYSQSLNKSTGLTKVLGDINGLTSLVSPDLKKIVYSESISGGLKTYLFDIAARTSAIMPVITLPEKCIWGGIEKTVLYCAVPATIPQADYPDTWYQGVTSLDDEIWKVDTITGNAELIIDRATLDRNGGLDAMNLILSPQEDYLLLTNKKDSSLWQIKIK